MQRPSPRWSVRPHTDSPRTCAQTGPHSNRRSKIMAVEQPAFDLLNQDGDIEIRQYRPLIVAETSIEGDLDSASSSGFKRIADYIFGNNTPAQAGAAKEKIAMTAPVTMEPQEGLTGIATHAARWRMQFVMPHVYTMATLPRPNNPEVTLREV